MSSEILPASQLMERLRSRPLANNGDWLSVSGRIIEIGTRPNTQTVTDATAVQLGRLPVAFGSSTTSQVTSYDAFVALNGGSGTVVCLLSGRSAISGLAEASNGCLVTMRGKLVHYDAANNTAVMEKCRATSIEIYVRGPR